MIELHVCDSNILMQNIAKPSNRDHGSFFTARNNVLQNANI